MEPIMFACKTNLVEKATAKLGKANALNETNKML